MLNERFVAPPATMFLDEKRASSTEQPGQGEERHEDEALGINAQRQEQLHLSKHFAKSIQGLRIWISTKFTAYRAGYGGQCLLGTTSSWLISLFSDSRRTFYFFCPKIHIRLRCEIFSKMGEKMRYFCHIERGKHEIFAACEYIQAESQTRTPKVVGKRSYWYSEQQGLLVLTGFLDPRYSSLV